MLTLIALMDNEVGAPRILFVTFPEPGHFNPILRVAQRASQRGATVAFFSLQGDLSQRLARAGVHAPSSYPRHADARTITAKREHRAEDFVARVRRGGAWYRQWLRYVLLDLVEPQRNELEKFVKEFRPDVISTDPLAYTGSIVADVAGIPWAAVSTNLVGAVPASWKCDYLDNLESFEGDLRAIFARCGARDPRLCRGDTVSPWLNTLFTTEALTPRALSGNDYAIYVGPSLERPSAQDAEFPWSRVDANRPAVYVASGTQFAFPKPFYGIMADAGASLAYTMIFAGSAAVDALQGREDVIATPFAPQLQVLERVAAMVTHGGANSVLEGLSKGRPLAVMPLGHEQFIQAMLVENAGIGTSAAVADLDQDRCAVLLRAVVEDRKVADRASSIARSFAATDGAARVAELLMELAVGRTPIAGVSFNPT